MSISQTPSRVGVHIGLPKTGTTSLQELFFSRHPDVKYFGQTNIWTDQDAKTILKSLLLDDLEDDFYEKARAIINQNLDNYKALVISDEAITFGEFMLRASRWPLVSDHRATATRIKQFAGDVQIFIVIRNQADWLVSWHRQGLKTGKYLETDMDKWFAREMSDSSDHLNDLLRFDQMYDAYMDVFGTDNVHLYLYEQHKNNLASIAEEISVILGVDKKLAYELMQKQARNVTGDEFISLPRFLHKLIRSTPARLMLKRIPKGLRTGIRRKILVNRKYSEVSDETLQTIRKRFSESNKLLFQRLGINAEGLGYFDTDEG